MHAPKKVVVRQIMNSGGEIRQITSGDSLIFLKPKLSALVNNLGRKGVISRTRYHRTNIPRPTKEFGGC
jgi:uncharacterized membrane protein